MRAHTKHASASSGGVVVVVVMVVVVVVVVVGGDPGGVGGGVLIPTGSNSTFEEWLQNYAKLMHQAVSSVFDTFCLSLGFMHI